MSLTYFYNDPSFLTLSDFSKLFDAAFDERTQSRDSKQSSQLLRPRMDLHESKDQNQITATFELPGLKKEDVAIDIHQNRLTVSGQSNFSNDLDKDGYTLRERRFGKFSRTLPLPAGVKPEEIQASMDNGILTVRFPKASADQATKRITIQ